MNIGTSQVDITPPVGVELSGYVAREQPSVGILDRLFARGLYCESKNARLLWLHADLIGFEHDFVVELKVELAARCDLAPHEIIVSATHTHSGPATLYLNHCGTMDPQYIEQLRDRLLQVGRDALARPAPAELLTAETHCDLGIERRGRSTPEITQRVGILAWRRRQEYVALLVNYGIHNVALGPANRHISGDMAGCAAEALARSLPGHPVVLMTNGAAGNINPPSVSDNYDNVQQWGKQLSTRVQAALLEASASTESLWSTSELLELSAPDPTPAEFEAVAARLRAPLAARTDRVTERIRAAIDAWYERMRQPRRGPNRVELQVLRIGAVDWVCVGAEVFSALPELLRRTTSRPTYVVSYANGVLGYLAPESAYAEGGYEVDQAFVWYGTLPIPRGAFEQVRERAAELLRAALPGLAWRPWSSTVAD